MSRMKEQALRDSIFGHSQRRHEQPRIRPLRDKSGEELPDPQQQRHPLLCRCTECVAAPKTVARDDDETCYLCGMLGHFSKDCPWAKHVPSTMEYWQTSEGTHLVNIYPDGRIRQTGVIWRNVV